MAAGRLPKPGTEFGPCEECSHIDCAETRSMAQAVCHYCEEPIGYDRGFYQSDGALVHSSCFEDAIEEERKKQEGTNHYDNEFPFGEFDNGKHWREGGA